MDGLSLLDPLAWKPEWLSQHPAYEVGNALGWLSRSSKQASVNHMLSGRLYLSKSGWLLLSVPNALARGVFDALTAPGAELPTAGALNVPNVKEELFNAHISVMTAAEVASIGADKINERGHVFHYGLGPVKEITPKNIEGVSKVWAVQVASPALTALRKSYGLPPLPNSDHQFHITVAVRRKKVLHNNDVCKFDTARGRGELKAASAPVLENFDAAKWANELLHGGSADGAPDLEFSAAALVKGKKHEHEHTDNDQIAKEIAKDHLQEDALYYKKIEQVEKEGNAYGDQLMATPLSYSKDQSVWQNVVSHAQRVKTRGDKQLEYQDSAERFRRALVPGYREQAFLTSLRQPQIDAKKPLKQRFDSFIEQAVHKYGDKALNHLNFGELNHMQHFG